MTDKPPRTRQGAGWGTRAVHAGLDPAAQGEPLLAGPVFAAPFHLRGPRRRRARTATGATPNPTWTRLEAALGELEAAETVVFASGMAAMSAVLLRPLWRRATSSSRRGDGYPGVRQLADEYLTPGGVDVRIVPTDTDAIVAAAAEGATLRVGRDARPTRARGVRPRRRGRGRARRAARCWRSTTRSRRRSASGRSPSARTSRCSAPPRRSAGTPTCCSARSRCATARWPTTCGAGARAPGAILGPFEAWLLHRSLATLELRLERSERQRARAGPLPGAGGSTTCAIRARRPSGAAAAARQMRLFGALVGFSLPSAERGRRRSSARCELVAEATSFGGVHSTAERRGRWGTDAVPEGFIRFSAGIEDTEDLVADVLAGARRVDACNDDRARRSVRRAVSMSGGDGRPGVSRRPPRAPMRSGVTGRHSRWDSRVRRSLWRDGRAAEPCRPSLCAVATSVSPGAAPKRSPSRQPRNSMMRPPVGETLEKPWRPVACGRQWVDEGLGHTALRPDRRRARTARDWSAGLPGRQGRLLFAYLVLQPRPRLPARRADRRPLARAAAGRGRHGAERAAVEAAPDARRRRRCGGRGGVQLRARAPSGRRRRARRGRGREAEAAIEAGDWAAALAAGRARDALLDDLQTLPARLRRPVAARAAPRARRDPPARRWRRSPRRACARAGASSGRRAGRARGDRRGAVPRVRAPPADGGPRGGRQPGRGAARVRGAALAAARGARDDARAGGDDRPRARCCAGEPPPRPSPVGARALDDPHTWPAPLAAAIERHAFVGRGARARATLEALLGGGGRRHARARAAGRRRRDRQDAPGRGAGRRAPTTAARSCSTGASTRRRSPPYQPLVEMLRGWSAGASLEALRDAARRARGRARRSCCRSSARRRAEEREPAARRRAPTPSACASSTRSPRCSPRSAPSAPLVLVFDDLHWADRPTLQLLRHLVRGAAARAGRCSLGTYREAELESDHPLRELIADAAPRGHAAAVELGGLAEPEVGRAGGGARRRRPSPAFLCRPARARPRATRSSSRRSCATCRDAGRPRRRDVTLDGGRRARRRARGDRPAPAAAAEPTRARRSRSPRVIGREFDYDVLEAVVAGLDDDALVSALEEGVEARVLRESGPGRPLRTSRTRWSARRCTTGSPSCGARGCTGASARRSSRAARRRPRSAAAAARPPLRAGRAGRAARARDRLRARRRAPRRPPAGLGGGGASTTGRRCARASWRATGRRSACGPSCCWRSARPRTGPGMEDEARATFAHAGDGPRARSATRLLLGRAALGFAGPWSTLARVDEERRRAARRGARWRSATRTAAAGAAAGAAGASSSTTPASRSGG